MDFDLISCETTFFLQIFVKLFVCALWSVTFLILFSILPFYGE